MVDHADSAQLMNELMILYQKFDNDQTARLISNEEASEITRELRNFRYKQLVDRCSKVLQVKKEREELKSLVLKLTDEADKAFE